MIAWGLVGALHGTAGIPRVPEESQGADLQMYKAVTKRVGAGENYYLVLADELPTRGYAIRPVFNWRLPTLTWLNVLPPAGRWSHVLLVALGIAVIVMWILVIRRAVPVGAIASVLVLIISIVPFITLGTVVLFHEIWAGLLIAAALAAWGLGYWRVSVGLGAMAMAIRELALPFAIMMAAIAWWEKKPREARAWAGAAVVFVALWILHISQVLQVLPAEGLRNSWVKFGGWPFAIVASHSALLLMSLPQWAVALLVPVAWAGFWYWTDELGRRLALVVSGYFALFMVAGRPDNWYWGFLIGPLLPLGFFGYFFGRLPRRRRRIRNP